MKNEVRFLCLSLLAAVVAGLGGCTHKPAYSEMDANKASRNQNQNQNQNAESRSAPPAPASGAAPEPTAPAPPPSALPLKSPLFFDQATGGIRDLPVYPNASRVSVQIGPVQDMNTMSIVLNTTDSMDKVAAFFERAIKDNKWTVLGKMVDQELSEWRLKKGEDNNAKVQVKKDETTKALNIIMVRAEKLEAPAK